MRIQLTIIFLITSTLCFSQQNKGVATYTIQSNYAFNAIENAEQKKVLKRIFEESGRESPIHFKLIFKDGNSVFFSENALPRNESKVDFIRVKAKILGKIYVDQKNKEIIQYKEKFGEMFRIKKSLSEHEWILTNEEQEIGKYTCFKAVLKSESKKKNQTIAWYAPELGCSIGPLGYCGLPGGIILLEDDIFRYSLKDIRFNLSKQDKKAMRKPKTGRKVSLRAYDSIYKVMREKKEALERVMYDKN